MNVPPRLVVCFAFLFAATCACAQSESNAPYLALRNAYSSADADAATLAYAEQGVYVELFSGFPPQTHNGRNRLREMFATFIDQVRGDDKKTRIDVNFRLVSRVPRADGSVDAGFYRVTATDSLGVESFRSYGRFATVIERSQFVFDANSAATRVEFESAKGPVMFVSDEERLDPDYYDALTGTYVGEDGCRVLLTRSAWRLFALDECTMRWRGLKREAGMHWRGGNRVIDPVGRADYRFSPAEQAPAGASASVALLTIAEDQSSPRTLRKEASLKREPVRFASQGLNLSGELLAPAKERDRRMPAVVLVHGSGEQDRHGYASVMRLLAERFARAGFVVLSYDKRGVGLSQGNWATAGFDALGADARAALDVLRSRRDVDPRSVGFAGSSQAGWVAGASIRAGATPDYVLMIGAAGAAFSVEEQNLYNTETRMRCAGVAAGDISLALDQQRAFFAARRTRSKAADARLSQLSDMASERASLRDWLFPDRVGGGGEPQWYDVLDPDFDPRTVWSAYPGRSYFLFAEHDDSTPSALAMARLSELKAAGPRRVRMLQGTQHNGLRASSVCTGELGSADGFHPDFFPAIDEWLAEIRAANAG